jgi:anti-anti-sigma factor
MTFRRFTVRQLGIVTIARFTDRKIVDGDVQITEIGEELAVLSKTTGNVLLDWSEVEFFTAACMKHIIDVQKVLGEKPIDRLRHCAVFGPILATMELTRLNGWFDIRPTLLDALRGWYDLRQIRLERQIGITDVSLLTEKLVLAHEIEQLGQELHACLLGPKGPPVILVNCADVSFVSSPALSTLIRFQEAVDAAQRTMAFFAFQDGVLEVIHRTGLHETTFTVCTTRDEALQELGLLCVS